MKYMTLICLLIVSMALNSKMIIHPVSSSEVNFGPTDYSVHGGIEVDTSKQIKNKAAGVYFDTDTRIHFIGTAEDTLTNLNILPNLTVNKPAGSLWLVDELSVQGNLDFITGDINTQSDTLRLPLSTSTMTGESNSGKVLGNVQAARNIGTGTSAATGNFGGIGFSINDIGADLGTVTVHRKTGTGSVQTIFGSEGIERTWTVETSIPFSGTRNVSASWLDSEDNSNRLSNLKVWKYVESKLGEWISIPDPVFSTGTSMRTETFDIDMATVFTVNNTDTYFAGGKGTQELPYLIRTAQHLDSIRYYLTSEFDSCYFKQIADIDLGVSPWNVGAGWDPIGSGIDFFKSKYDGDIYSIRNLTINRPAEGEIGLFGYTIGAYIQNVTLDSADVTGLSNVGALTGSSDSSSFVYNCSASGTVAGGNNVGGMVGFNKNYSSLESSHSSCNVSASTFTAGGLVGTETNYSNILSCSATGNVSAPEYTGGLVGSNSDSYINYSFSSGSITGTNYLGGMIGYDYNSNIMDSYSTGSVTGTSYLGGLIGYAYDTYLYNTYSIGEVSGSSDLGGLVGYENYTDCYYSYWDTETSGQISSAVGVGKTTDDMTFPADFFTYENWDFTFMPVWDINYGVNVGYPYLHWQNLPNTNFAGGSGTDQDPYLVETATHLDAVRYYPAAYFRQIADIDLGVLPWTDSTGWKPIGEMWPEPFQGSYNGDGYNVSNMVINRPMESDIGLFGYCNYTASIQNLEVLGADVTGNMNVGILMGTGDEATVSKCGTSGTVQGEYYTGGMIGYVYYTTIDQCYSSANVTVNWDGAGGLVGYMNSSGTVYDSYASGEVTGSTNTGGFIGYNFQSNVIYCYSTGAVSGAIPTGGFIGLNDWGYIYNSYWDTQTSGQLYSSGGTGRTTAEMTYPVSDSTYVEWDFSVTPKWVCSGSANVGYPYLAWQDFTGGLTAPGNVTISVASNTITINWNEVSGATGYAVYSSLDPYGTFGLDESGSLNGTEWVVTPLPGTKKFYYVTATDGSKKIPKKINVLYKKNQNN